MLQRSKFTGLVYTLRASSFYQITNFSTTKLLITLLSKLITIFLKINIIIIMKGLEEYSLLQTEKKMALETMVSLSDLLSFLLSSKPSSPSLSPPPPSLKPITRYSQCTSWKPLQHLTMTTKIFTADNDDVINRVAYPSLANANLVFFKSGNYNVEVVPKDGESEEQLLNDFKRSCFRAGVLQESRRRRFFESSQEKTKRKTKEAAKKYRKRLVSSLLLRDFEYTIGE